MCSCDIGVGITYMINMAAHLKLNNGATIPALGLGTITFNDSPEKIKNAILTALRVLPTPPTLYNPIPPTLCSGVWTGLQGFVHTLLLILFISWKICYEFLIVLSPLVFSI